MVARQTGDKTLLFFAYYCFSDKIGTHSNVIESGVIVSNDIHHSSFIIECWRCVFAGVLKISGDVVNISMIGRHKHKSFNCSKSLFLFEQWIFVAVYFRTKVRRRSSETRTLLRIKGMIEIFKSLVLVECLKI